MKFVYLEKKNSNIKENFRMKFLAEVFTLKVMEVIGKCLELYTFHWSS